MRKHTIIGGIVAGAAMLALLPGQGLAAPERDGRPSRGNNKVTWVSEGVTPTTAGVSVDGPKSSNAAVMNPGSYIYPSGYWDMTLADASWKFSYIAAELTGAGQIRWSVSIGDNDGPWLYLDPYHCPGAVAENGWATVDFQQAGIGCTIYDSDGHVFTGDDPNGVDGLPGTGDEAAAQSAWQKLEAAHGTSTVWISFLIQDGASSDAITVDRVGVAGNTLSKF